MFSEDVGFVQRRGQHGNASDARHAQIGSLFPSDYGGMAWMSGLGGYRRLQRHAGLATIGRKKSAAMGIEEHGMPVAMTPFIFTSFAW